MIVSVRHTAIVVSDIVGSKHFYESIGIVEFASKTEKGDIIDKVTGINNVVLEWVKLKSKDGFVLELLQYHSHNEVSDLSTIPPNRIGYSHIAITVENIYNSCKKILSLGGKVINDPCVSEDGNVKLVYCYDAEGMLLELVEELK